jgi:hypothetical protein
MCILRWSIRTCIIPTCIIAMAISRGYPVAVNPLVSFLHAVQCRTVEMYSLE